MIVVTAAGGPTGTAVVRALRERGEAVRAVVAGRRPRPELEELGAEVVLVSGNLARREALKQDLARAREAEVYVVELKAAAIDVVAEAAVERGVELVLADN